MGKQFKKDATTPVKKKSRESSGKKDEVPRQSIIPEGGWWNRHVPRKKCRYHVFNRWRGKGGKWKRVFWLVRGATAMKQTIRSKNTKNSLDEDNPERK